MSSYLSFINDILAPSTDPRPTERQAFCAPAYLKWSAFSPQRGLSAARRGGMATSSFSKLWGRPHAPAPASTTSSSQSATLPPSPERHPKPAHQRQCSSPSFVETYARYVERLRRDEKLLEQGAGIQREGGPTIKALFPREQEVEERSPDTRKDTTDSSYSSWPGMYLLCCFLLLCGAHAANKGREGMRGWSS